MCIYKRRGPPPIKIVEPPSRSRLRLLASWPFSGASLLLPHPPVEHQQPSQQPSLRGALPSAKRGNESRAKGGRAISHGQGGKPMAGFGALSVMREGGHLIHITPVSSPQQTRPPHRPGAGDEHSSTRQGPMQPAAAPPPQHIRSR